MISIFRVPFFLLFLLPLTAFGAEVQNPNSQTPPLSTYFQSVTLLKLENRGKGSENGKAHLSGDPIADSEFSNYLKENSDFAATLKVFMAALKNDTSTVSKAARQLLGPLYAGHTTKLQVEIVLPKKNEVKSQVTLIMSREGKSIQDHVIRMGFEPDEDLLSLIYLFKGRSIKFRSDSPTSPGKILDLSVIQGAAFGKERPEFLRKIILYRSENRSDKPIRIWEGGLTKYFKENPLHYESVTRLIQSLADESFVESARGVLQSENIQHLDLELVLPIGLVGQQSVTLRAANRTGKDLVATETGQSVLRKGASTLKTLARDLGAQAQTN